MHERQLDGVGDLLDLFVEATNVRVGNIWHLFEHEVFNARPWKFLDDHVGTLVEQNCVAGL